jgi:hypothetical protein
LRKQNSLFSTLKLDCKGSGNPVKNISSAMAQIDIITQEGGSKHSETMEDGIESHLLLERNPTVYWAAGASPFRYKELGRHDFGPHYVSSPLAESILDITLAHENSDVQTIAKLPVVKW